MTSNQIFAFFVLLLSATFAYSQQELPPDFPVFQDTGDRVTDNERYNTAKLAWIEANPDLYRQMGGQIKPKPKPNPFLEEAEKC